MKSPSLLQAASFAAACFVFGTAEDARAYCRTQTCGNDCDSFTPEGCPIGKHDLFWETSCVNFAVQESGSELRGLSFETMQAATQAAFKTWQRSACGAKAPSLGVREFDSVVCRQPTFNVGRGIGNANVILARDADWPYRLGGHAIALTTVTFDANTGEILDADVELNTHQFSFSLSSDRVGVDLQAVLTHELGHFLGLDHSNVPDATMSTTYDYGSTNLRDVDVDDQAGLCKVYGAADGTPVCGSTQPFNGFASGCEERVGPADDGGCSISRHPRGGSGLWVTALALLGAFGRRRSAKSEGN